MNSPRTSGALILFPTGGSFYQELLHCTNSYSSPSQLERYDMHSWYKSSMNNPFSSAKGENLTSEARSHQSHPAVTSAPQRKELQLTLVTVEIVANAYYSQSPIIEALWRGSRSISAIQSNIPRKHWSLVWVWHLFLRSVQSPDSVWNQNTRKRPSHCRASLYLTAVIQKSPSYITLLK